MTETKRCCDRCYIPLEDGEKILAEICTCSCHTPVSKPKEHPKTCKCYGTGRYGPNGTLECDGIPTPPPTEGWECKLSSILSVIRSQEGNIFIGVHESEKDRLFNFFSTLLAEQKASMVEVVRGMEKDENRPWDDADWRQYNEACSDIIKALSK